jgi:hypothetical protein
MQSYEIVLLTLRSVTKACLISAIRGLGSPILKKMVYVINSSVSIRIQIQCRMRIQEFDDRKLQNFKGCFKAGPDLAFNSNADPDTAQIQSDGNLRPLAYRPSRAPFRASKAFEF